MRFIVNNLMENKKAKLKGNLHLIWNHKLKNEKNIEDYIKAGKKQKIDPQMSLIDPEKYPIIANKSTLNEINKDEYVKKDQIKGEQTGNYLKYAENILKEMKKKNKQLVIDSARVVVKNAHIAIINDKKKLDFEKENFDFRTYKYINDKLFPQMIKGLSQNPSTHLKELKIRADKDSKVLKHCKKIEEKIQKDIECKLSDNYYEQKNADLQNIFMNRPENYYVKNKKGGTPGASLKKKKKDEKKKHTNNVDSDEFSNKIETYKETLNLILNAVEKENIAKYISAPFTNGSKFFIQNFMVLILSSNTNNIFLL